MAECSYARCVQQRRNIRRDLQRWTRNMVHIVGLERIAEELMGRRKWKLYQESMSRNCLQPLNNNIKRTNESVEGDDEDDCHHKEVKHNNVQITNNNNNINLQQQVVERTANGGDEAGDGDDGIKEQQKENNAAKDWRPDTKCYFCVDGKLDSEHTSHGVLSPHQTDSDSSDSHSDGEIPTSLTSTSRGLLNNNHHSHRPTNLRHHHPAPPPNIAMTTIESMALAVAALSGASGAAPNGPAPGLPPHPHLPTAAAAAAFYGPASVLTHNWYLNVARSFAVAAAASSSEAAAGDKGAVTGAAAAAAAVAAAANLAAAAGGGEQPLDLSKGSSSTLSSNNGGSTTTNTMGGDQKHGANSLRLPTLDTKHIFNSDFRAKPRMSAVAGRRTYTEDELQAALRDIQSGKLGTRRAAVIYGIPRSTLRNKVYKLALERERESHLNTPLKLDEEEAMDDDKELSGAEEEKEVEKALEAPLLSSSDFLRFGLDQAPEALRQLLQKGKEVGPESWAGLDHSEVGPYIQNLLLTSQLAASQRPTGAAIMNHMIPEVVKRMMAEEQMNNNGDSEKLIRPSPSNSVITRVEKARSESDMETEDSPSNVILKIPSFKPTSSKNGCDIFRNMVESTGSMVSPPVTSESSSPPILPPSGKPPSSSLVIKDVKDVIAQNISQKFQQTMAAVAAEPTIRRPPLEVMDFKRGAYTPPLGAPQSLSVIKAAQEMGRQPYQQQSQQHHVKQQQQQQQQQSGGGTTGGKGTRPKRGKYRNYDRDSLVEAVRAVQRGEMSVHRAGSYYGVPHSTLEYKVKERHLMRPRKRDPKPNPVDEKIASLKQNDLRNAQEKMKPVMKAPQKFSATSPNGMKLPIFEPGMTPLAGYNPAPFPFWPHPSFTHIPMDYARNPNSPFSAPNPEFFASQMMQKLQEESSRTIGNSASVATAPTLAKNARQMAESLLESASGSNGGGSFLDGIIRSSLESGVPPGGGGGSSRGEEEDEERHIAPENMSNKALLDQLCRNSRLTPLSKTEGGVSSGEEDSGGRRGSSGSPLNFTTGLASQETNDDDSSSQYNNNKDVSSDVHTIELSNDSNASSNSTLTNNRKHLQLHNTTNNASETSASEDQQTPLHHRLTSGQKQPRIYLKQELAKPENLKPEMLVRFRSEVLVDNNGTNNESSASENDATQD